MVSLFDSATSRRGSDLDPSFSAGARLLDFLLAFAFGFGFGFGVAVGVVDLDLVVGGDVGFAATSRPDLRTDSVDVDGDGAGTDAGVCVDADLGRFFFCVVVSGGASGVGVSAGSEEIVSDPVASFVFVFFLFSSLFFKSS